MPLHHHGPPAWVVNWTRPGRLYAADGVTLKQLNHNVYTAQTTPQDGDRFQFMYICSGSETRLSLSTHKQDSRGIFDLYVNDILDSSGYDDYNAVDVYTYRYIILTQPIRSGKNTIELRVNGKNVASVGYLLDVYGGSLQ